MKTATAYSGYCTNRRPVAFPNAATTRQVIHNLLDKVLLFACGLGAAAILLLLMVL